MTANDRLFTFLFVGMFVGMLCLIVLIGVGFSWYKAGLQSEVYHRQGIHITQWELFIGVNPAEKVIQIRQ